MLSSCRRHLKPKPLRGRQPSHQPLSIFFSAYALLWHGAAGTLSVRDERKACDCAGADGNHHAERRWLTMKRLRLCAKLLFLAAIGSSIYTRRPANPTTPGRTSSPASRLRPCSIALRSGWGGRDERCIRQQAGCAAKAQAYPEPGVLPILAVDGGGHPSAAVDCDRRRVCAGLLLRVHHGYIGGLPWIVTLVGLPWSAHGVVYACYLNMCKSDHSEGGITFESAKAKGFVEDPGWESPAI